MDTPNPDPTQVIADDVAALNRRLAFLQAAVFGWIAIAALIAMQLANPELDSAPPRNWTVAAILLAVGSISLRSFSTSPVMQSRARLVLGTLALLLAAGVAACGAGIAWNGGPRQPALAFSIGAALLAIRRPSVALSEPERR